MTTEVKMQRAIFGEIISQKSKSGFLNATELMRVGNKLRAMHDLDTIPLNNYFNNSSTKSFMEKLKDKYGTIKTTGKGKKGGTTWVHPLLFLDIALWINPNLKVEVYEWISDNLLDFRNSSGDSYKKMVGTLYLHSKLKKDFPKNIAKVANLIKKECGVLDWNSATEQQLKLRDKMHDYISFASDMLKDGSQGVYIGIARAKKEILLEETK